MEDQPNLDENTTDFVVAGGKAALALLPYIGPIVAEIVGTLIPRQRMDRIAEYLEILGDKVKDLDAECARKR